VKKSPVQEKGGGGPEGEKLTRQKRGIPVVARGTPKGYLLLKLPSQKKKQEKRKASLALNPKRKKKENGGKKRESFKRNEGSREGVPEGGWRLAKSSGGNLNKKGW